MRSFVASLFFFWGLICVPTANADFTLHLGPVASGTGGPNPISIPPTQILEYEFVWIISKTRELSLSIIPGIFYGARFSIIAGAYVSLGGGVAIDSNGVGPGVYSALGYDACSGRYCFNVEYKKALGITQQTIIAPYAIRIGMTWKTAS